MRTLVIPDFHAPFNHKGAVEFLLQLKEEYEPDEVVCIGDEIDQHNWGRHGRHADLPGGNEEIAKAIEQLQPLFEEFPDVKVCRSNHGDRAFKAAGRQNMPSRLVRTVKEVLDAPDGWVWAPEWIVDDVLYCHGEGVSGPNGASTMATRNLCSTVIGHLHAFGGVQWLAGPRKSIFAANTGCLIDPKSPAFEYYKGPKRPVLGAMVVLDRVPHFIPLR